MTVCPSRHRNYNQDTDEEEDEEDSEESESEEEEDDEEENDYKAMGHSCKCWSSAAGHCPPNDGACGRCRLTYERLFTVRPRKKNKQQQSSSSRQKSLKSKSKKASASKQRTGPSSPADIEELVRHSSGRGKGEELE